MSKQEPQCIGLVAAFSWEVRPLLRHASPVTSAETPDHGRPKRPVYELPLAGMRALLLVGGAGNENSYRAGQYLARHFPLRGLASVGFAGGLVSGVRAGAVVAAGKVADEQTNQWFTCDPGLLPARCDLRGDLVATSTVICNSAQKRALGQQWGAVAVDMESAGVARAAVEAHLPFFALKAITDPVEQTLSIDFEGCRSEDKDFSLLAVVRQGLTTFQGVGDLLRLGWNSRRAAGALATALQ